MPHAVAWALGALDPGRLARAALVAASPLIAVLLSVALDIALLTVTRDAPAEIILAALLFNGASILQASVGAIIEVRRPGHRIGRLLMVTGPLYALVAALWLTAEVLEALVGPQWTAILTLIGQPLSYIAVTLFVVGVPLLFPTGSLPGRRWRVPVGILSGLLVGGMTAAVTHPGPLGPTSQQNPLGIPGWPPALEVLENLIPVAVLGLIVLGLASQVIRYRFGTEVERLQVRWLAAAVAVVLAGFVGVFVELVLRTSSGPLLSGIVAYVGILLMPVAIGIAILRYRLYEIDRLVSRTIGWAVVTGILAAVFIGLVVTLQALLASITSESTLAVAASTLVAFALFQPVRRRVQRAVDRRFDRARYDGERVAAAFAERLRDQVDLAGVEHDIRVTVGAALSPASAGVWLRAVRPSGQAS